MRYICMEPKASSNYSHPECKTSTFQVISLTSSSTVTTSPLSSSSVPFWIKITIFIWLRLTLMFRSFNLLAVRISAKKTTTNYIYTNSPFGSHCDGKWVSQRTARKTTLLYLVIKRSASTSPFSLPLMEEVEKEILCIGLCKNFLSMYPYWAWDFLFSLLYFFLSLSRNKKDIHLDTFWINDHFF